MNIEKYTERARGFIQNAQQLALGHGPPAVRAAAPAQGPARRRRGHGGRPDRARRRRRARWRGPRPKPALKQDSQGLRRRRPALSQPRTGAGLRHRREARRRRPATRSSPSSACCSRWWSKRTPMPARSWPSAGVTPQALNEAINEIRKGRTADSASAENSYDALKKYARDLTAGGARRQARPGDRPRRGNPPHHPGAEPPHQEQSGADRRARRRQDRHRRRPRHPHRQWRRARIAQEQVADVARHGRADRRREISRRVRGAAEGRAQRDHRRPTGRSSCSSTRCTRWSAPARPMARWMRPTC